MRTSELPEPSTMTSQPTKKRNLPSPAKPRAKRLEPPKSKLNPKATSTPTDPTNRKTLEATRSTLEKLKFKLKIKSHRNQTSSKSSEFRNAMAKPKNLRAVSMTPKGQTDQLYPHLLEPDKNASEEIFSSKEPNFSKTLKTNCQRKTLEPTTNRTANQKRPRKNLKQLQEVKP